MRMSVSSIYNNNNTDRMLNLLNGKSYALMIQNIWGKDQV